MSALREIIARFGVSFDTKALDAGAKKIEQGRELLLGFGKVLGGAFLAKAAKDFAVGMISDADALAKQSRALGVSVEALQEWQYAAESNNVSAQKLNDAFTRIASGKYDAEGLRQLGVTATDTTGKLRPAHEVLESVADGLRKLKDPAQRARVASQVLGKSYLDLMPMLEGGADGLRQLREEFRELGGVIDAESVQRAEEVSTQWGKLKTIFRGVGVTVMTSILPVILSLSKRLADMTKHIRPLLANGKLLQALFGVGVVAGVVKLSSALGPLNRAFGLLGKRLLTIVAPILVLEDFLVFLAGGDSVIGEAFKKAFGEAKTDEIRQDLLKMGESIKEIGQTSKNTLSEWLADPQRFKDDWSVFLSQLKKDIPGLSTMILSWSLAWDMSRAAAELYFGTLKTVGGTVIGFLTDVVQGFGSSWDNVLSTMRSAFETWAGFVTGTLGTILGAAGKLAGVLGASSTGGALKDLAGDLRKVSERHRKMADPNERAFDAFFRDMGTTRGNMPQRFVNPRVTTGDVHVEVNVPPGTPETVGKRIGKAAARIVDTSLRGAAAALHMGQG